jgi:hypothetical protein
MTAFGPATESCTYILLAPALAWALLEAFSASWPRWITFALIGSQVLLVLTQTAVWFPGARQFRDLGPQPFAALLVLVSLLALSARELMGWGRRMRSLPKLPAPILY